MEFMYAYKRLEKICTEMFAQQSGVSAYIAEMERLQKGQYKVDGWEEDLKRLKHYRWIRNKIVHELDCTEQNMCKPSDTQWISAFYSRIMNRTDPLALYYKRTLSPRRSGSHKQTNQANTSASRPGKRSSIGSVGCMNILLIAVLLIAVVLVMCFSQLAETLIAI